MNRTTRTIVVVCIALITAGAATYVVYQAIQQMPVREVQVPGTPVVVAVKSLTSGTQLTAEHVRLARWPADSPVPRSYAKVADVIGHTLSVPIYENEPITESTIDPSGATATLQRNIPEGMRAVAVRVDDVNGVAGFVGPGTHVDVLATVRAQGSGRESTARTILSNVPVLASGTKQDEERVRDGKSVSSPVVLLAVAPDDALRITLAAAEGRISLALRNPLDNIPTENSEIGVASLLKGSTPAPVEEKPAPKKKASPKPVELIADPPPARVAEEPEAYKVEVIRAAKITDQEVR